MTRRQKTTAPQGFAPARQQPMPSARSNGLRAKGRLVVSVVVSVVVGVDVDFDGDGDVDLVGKR